MRRTGERPVNVFLVTTTADSVPGSFRQAIHYANASAGLDQIGFMIPGTGTKYVRPKDVLPDITDPVIIDGTTAIGYAGTPVIDLDGSLAGLANGLDVVSGSCTIKGIAVTRFELSGIGITGGGCTIEGCYIGVDPDGVTDAGNALDGITVVSANNWIGVPGGARNVISGNGRCGVLTRFPSSTGNRIANCYIGTTADGSAALRNDEWGVLVWDTQQITVGGATAEFRNVISGNLLSGIGIWGAQAQQVVIQGNYIGTNATGYDSIPNRYNGIEVQTNAGDPQNPSGILIGGKMAGEGNVISGNAYAGIAFFLDTLGGAGIVVAGNMIGANSAGSLPIPNSLGIYATRIPSSSAPPPMYIGGSRSDSANVISGNTGYGIWFQGPGTRGNHIRGNYVGTTPPVLGTLLPLGNGDAGIFLDESPENTIGGTVAEHGNVICSNTRGGIAVVGSGAAGNQIFFNWIGTDPAKNDPLGNKINGIYLAASQTTVGAGTTPNTIAFNEQAGIFVFSGTRNRLRRNVLYGNRWHGIDLDSVGISRPDTLDADTGPNERQNFPVLDSATVEPFRITVHGTLLGKPTTSYSLDFYRNDERSPSKFGEGKTFLGSRTLATDASGQVAFDLVFTAAVSDSEFITAMATDPNGNSSEFCRALCLKDSDGDGLFDCWEKPGDGIDINNDGLMDIDLYARGARPDHKDIFVEVDHMQSAIVVQAALDSVIHAFARVPNRLLNNPDGRDGISLHIQYEPADSTVKPDVPWAVNPWPEFFAAKKTYFGTATERALPNGKYLLLSKRLAYRYCIFIDSFGPSGWSGMGEYNNGLANNDFIVSVGNWVRETNIGVQAGTFMHELGHTLGLGHGGGDDRHYKPNYFSVMNYAWQLPQARTSTSLALGWKLDYSPAELPALDENNLNESKGLDPRLEDFPEAVIFPFNSVANRKRTGIRWPGARVDWDGNGDSSGAATTPVDVNFLNPATESATPGETDWSYADWPNLAYDFRKGPNFHDPGGPALAAPQYPTLPTLEEMTPEIYDSLSALPPYGYLPPEAVPILSPGQSSVVGGNRATLKLSLSAPARPGGVTYTLASTDPTILSVPSTLTIYEGWTEAIFDISTRGVLRDTIVSIRVGNTSVATSASVHVLPANLASFTALADSGCVVGELGAFRKKFLAGAAILFRATLDGEAPPVDTSFAITSSRPDMVAAPATAALGAYTRNAWFVGSTSAGVSSAQQIVVTVQYRGVVQRDTVTVVPAPRYEFRDISPPDIVGGLYYRMQITNTNDVLMTDGGGSGWLWRNGVHERLDTLTHLYVLEPAINDSGWIAGRDSLGRAAIWKQGATTVLPVIDSMFSYCIPAAINNHGDVTGICAYDQFSSTVRAVVWRGALAVPMGTYGDYAMYPVDINDAGQVLADGGYYYSFQNFSYISFFWDNGVYTPIPHPLFPDYWARMYARRMNNSGQALLSSSLWYSRGDDLLFLWKAGVYDTVGTLPPFNFANPTEINNAGEFVGSVRFSVEDLPAIYSAFVATGGSVYDLECIADFPPGWDVRDAMSVNDAGIIVGKALVGGEDRAFMLTPGGPTGIDGSRGTGRTPERFLLEQNYPNPFNPSTAVGVELPVKSEVTLRVYDMLGREVATLMNGPVEAGRHLVHFDASRLASGVYFYRLDAGKFTQTRKMILLR